MNYPEQVKAFLWRIISEMAENPWLFAKEPDTDFTRKRKLCFEDLVRFLISKENGTTRHEILKYFDYDPAAPSNPALCQQRKKLLVEAFQYLLHHFNSAFQAALYRGRYTLVACDGCEFNIARDPDDPDTFHPASGQSTRGFNMLHATTFYDLMGKRYLDCVVQPGRKKNEYRAICDLTDRYAYGGEPIVIADRGFPSYNFFAHAKEKNILYMVRAKDLYVKRLLKLGKLTDDIDTSVDIIITRTQSKKRWLHPELEDWYKYVCPSVPFDYIERGSYDEYPLRLRVVRFAVADGTYMNIVTNLPADGFPPEVVKELYHLRWGIETSYRDLKHTIGTTDFISKKPGYIEQEIWARLILYNFCSIITADVVIARGDTKHIYQVNFYMAMKICHHFIRRRERDPPIDVETLIGSHTLPIRLGRNYARKHRFQSPASFCYR